MDSNNIIVMPRQEKNARPFFSVITCSYNSQKFLAENIKSLRRQDCRDFEHIFVDANSTDGTVELVKNYQAQQPGQVRLCRQPPQGIANAMNFGISQANGRIILILHSDDYLFSPKTLETVKDLFTASKAQIIVGDCMFSGENGEELIWPKNKLKRFLQKRFFRNFLFFTNGIPHPSTYVAKEVFDRYGGFSEEFKNVMDYEFWFRVFKKARVKFTDQALSVYRAHPGTISNLFSDRAQKEIQKVFSLYRKEYRRELFVNGLIFKPFSKLFKLGRARWVK